MSGRVCAFIARGEEPCEDGRCFLANALHGKPCPIPSERLTNERLTKAQHKAVGLFVLEHALNGTQHAALLKLVGSLVSQEEGR